MIIESYSVSPPIEGVCKQHAIWGHNGNQIFPLVYLQRPKWIKDDKEWEQIVDSIALQLKKDTKISGDINP